MSDWHLDKRVPITLIFSILAQTAAMAWFISSMDAGIENNSKDLIRHEARIDSLELAVQSQAVSLARIDENIKAIRGLLETR